MHPFRHHKLLHIMSVIRLKAFWYFCLRCLSAYNYIMCKGIKPSSHCLLPAHSTHFLCCCRPFIHCFTTFLIRLSFHSLHSVWQVRSFVDTSFVGDHSFPRIAQPYCSSLTISAVHKNASPASLHFAHSTTAPFVIPFIRSFHALHSPTAAHSMVPSITSSAPFFRAGRLLSHIPRHSVLPRKTPHNVIHSTIFVSC